MKLCDEKNMCHSRSLAPTDAVHQIPNEKKIRYTKWTINPIQGHHGHIVPEESFWL